MSGEKVTVARFNRRLLSGMICVICAVAAISFIGAFSPRKRLSAQEAAQQGSKTDAPDASKPKLPDDVAAAPVKYSDLARPGDKAPGQGYPPAADDLASPVAPGTTPAAPQEVGATPHEQASQARADLRRKDTLNAVRAPVNFAGINIRGQDQPQVKETGGSLPEVSGIMKMANSLAPGQVTTETEDQNQQTEKRGFAKENRNDFPYLKTTMLTPISQYEIKAGSIFPGVLITGINSDLPGQITAQVSENVYDTISGRFLLVPQGSRLIGEYDSKISYAQERLLVIWTRIIMPNGNSIGLEGMPGIDLSGYAGVGGDVNNHYGKLVAGVVLGSVIGAGAQVAAGGQGSPNVPASFSQLFVAGAAGNINQAGQQITQKNLNLQPTVEVSPGQKINVFLTKDMILKPYLD